MVYAFACMRAHVTRARVFVRSQACMFYQRSDEKKRHEQMFGLILALCEGQQKLRTRNSELYYTRIENLGNGLFLQSVLATLHANK